MKNEYCLRYMDEFSQDTGEERYFDTLNEAFQNFLLPHSSGGCPWMLLFGLPDGRRVRLIHNVPTEVGGTKSIKVILFPQ